MITLSTVNPNFSKRTFAGAEAPSRSIPIISPFSPTYLYQLSVEPASVAGFNQFALPHASEWQKRQGSLQIFALEKYRAV
jgi:hypothetical protein